MNRRIWSFAILLALLALPAIATAQPALRSFGFGAAVGSIGDMSSTVIAVPVNATPTIRVEPLIGLSNTSSTSENSDADSKEESSRSNITVGAGVFYMLRTQDAFLMYVGPRFGVNLASSENISEQGDQKSETTMSRTDIFLGLGFGGEFFFNPRFSLGAEVGLSVVMTGDPTTETKAGGQTSEDKDEESGLAMNTNGFLWGRFYY